MIPRQPGLSPRSQYMQNTCMSVSMQIRDVPDDVRDAIASRAANKGLSVQAFLLDVLRKEATLGRFDDMFARTASYRIPLSPDASQDLVDLITKGRDGGAEVDRE